MKRWIVILFLSGLVLGHIGAAENNSSSMLEISKEINGLGASPALANLTPEARAIAFREKLAELRARILEYTRTHTGKDLNNTWKQNYVTVFVSSLMHEWIRIEDADAAIRAQWDVLEQCQADDPTLPAIVAMEIVHFSFPYIAIKNLKIAAALLDDTAERFLDRVGEQGRGDWNTTAMHHHQLLVYNLGYLPESEHRQFLRERCAALHRFVVDRAYSMENRTRIVCDFAICLDNIGEVELAAQLLDSWIKEHGEQVVTVHYCYARFFAAIHGAGGWAVAVPMANMATRIMSQATERPDNPLYQLIIKGYYAHITHSDYELMRRATLYRAEARRTNRYPTSPPSQ